MKLRIAKQPLNDAIQHVSKAIAARTTIPILSGIKIDVNSSGMTLTASDTDISIQSFIPLEENEQRLIDFDQPGSVVVPGKLFVEIIRKLPTDDIEITVQPPFLVHVKSGKSELQMVGLDPEEYPILPLLDESKKISIESDQLKTMIRRTIFAVSTNESTPVLTGVLWNFQQERLKFVATDRHRLSTTEQTIQAGQDVEFHNIVISGKNLTELQKLLPDQNEVIDIVVSDNQVLFKMDRLLFYSRILDGVYPDTSKIIPQTYKAELVIETKPFLQALERAYLLSREEKTNIVKLITLEQSMVEISSSLSELGKITEQIETSSMTGEDVSISFNAKFMLDALKSIDCERFRIGFTGTMSPIIIRPNDEEPLLHLILPYRTSS